MKRTLILHFVTGVLLSWEVEDEPIITGNFLHYDRPCDTTGGRRHGTAPIVNLLRWEITAASEAPGDPEEARLTSLIGSDPTTR